jgi:hypothetical protein
MQQLGGPGRLSSKIQGFGFSRAQLVIYNRRTVSEREKKPKQRIGIEDLAPKLPKQVGICLIMNPSVISILAAYPHLSSWLLEQTSHTKFEGFHRRT